MKKKLCTFYKTKNTKHTKHKIKAQKRIWVLYTFGMYSNKRQKGFTLIKTIVVISYSWKKGRESKCQFDFWPLKVKNFLELHAFKKRATYIWKTFDKKYNFSLDLTSIRGLHKKLWASKVTKVPILGNCAIPEKNVVWV